MMLLLLMVIMMIRREHPAMGVMMDDAPQLAPEALFLVERTVRFSGRYIQ